MSVYKDVNITLTGQVPDDWNDNDYELLVAELRVIAAKYRLEVDEL